MIGFMLTIVLMPIARVAFATCIIWYVHPWTKMRSGRIPSWSKISQGV